MTGAADRWIRRTTTGCVALLALIAGTVSYLHMHRLVALHGQPGWVAALTPLSVDGMIVAASTTLLTDSRSGHKGGALPWALLIIGRVASLAANVAVAEPTLVGRVIAAWPSFALTASYELLTRQVRRGAARPDAKGTGERPSWPTPAGVVPFAGDEVLVPAQDRGRGNREDLRPPAAAHQPRQRRKPEPVGMIPPQSATELATKHLVLVAQHQQLGILGQVRADQHRQQAEQAPHQSVEQRQHHPEMVPATLPTPQQNPSSHYETEFPSGVRLRRAGFPGSRCRASCSARR
jgi:Protein of unknown function (DUF2637)